MVGPVLTATLHELRTDVTVAASKLKGITVRFEDGRVEAIDTSSSSGELSDSAKYVFAAAKALATIGAVIEGVDITITSTVPTAGGLASSGAFCVALVAGMAAFKDISLTERDLASLAFVAEHDLLKIPCGQMDQFAIVTGGIVALNCANTPPECTTLKIPSNLIFVVGWTDTQMKFSDSAIDLQHRWQEREPKLIQYIETTVGLIDELVVELRNPKSDLQRLGRLVSSCHESIRDDKGIVNNVIERYCNVAREAGAFGAKSAGARSIGGSMFALCTTHTSRAVYEALRNEGAHAVITTVDSNGVLL